MTAEIRIEGDHQDVITFLKDLKNYDGNKQKYRSSLVRLLERYGIMNANQIVPQDPHDPPKPSDLDDLIGAIEDGEDDGGICPPRHLAGGPSVYHTTWTALTAVVNLAAMQSAAQQPGKT